MKLKEAVALFEITNACNMDCRHCYRQDLGGFQLSLEEIKVIIEKISKGGVTSLILTGGEPLLRKDIFEIIDYAVDCGMEDVVINTNGIKLNDPKIIAAIERRLDVISALPVSFDGAKPETHDFIRGNGQFLQLMKILENKVLAEFPIGINVTLGSWNFKDFGRFFELYDELKALDINFGLFVPFGAGKQLADQVLSPAQCRELIEMSKEKYEAGYDVELCSVPASRLLIKEISGLCCNVFRDVITITAKGNVIPCILYDFNCGSLLEMDLKKIMSNKLVKLFRNHKKLQKKMTGYCNSCRKFHLCRGGCKLVTYALKGTIFDSDPLCPFQNSVES